MSQSPQEQKDRLVRAIRTAKEALKPAYLCRVRELLERIAVEVEKLPVAEREMAA